MSFLFNCFPDLFHIREQIKKADCYLRVSSILIDVTLAFVDPTLWNHPLNVFSKCLSLVFVLLLVRSCLLITLIICLKGHMFLGSLFIWQKKKWFDFKVTRVGTELSQSKSGHWTAKKRKSWNKQRKGDFLFSCMLHENKKCENKKGKWREACESETK